MLAFLAVVWWLDRYDREPAWQVAVVFFWGAFFAAGASYLTNTVGQILLTLVLANAVNVEWLSVMFLAPFVEEPTKALVLVIIALARRLDNATDGFVYGAAAGLGFAMTENIMYFTRAAETSVSLWYTTILIRTATSGLMHALASSIAGASLGWGMTRTRDLRLVAGTLGIVTAVAVHVVWNGLIVIGQASGTPTFWLDVFVFFCEFALIFAIFMLCVHGEHRMILRELKEEADGGVLPPQHVAILASVSRRNRTGWCPDGVDQRRYIELATRLAFRRMQCRGRGRQQQRYLQEARALRHQLRALLGTKPLTVRAPKPQPLAQT